MVEGILRVARERLGRGWCQGCDALDVNGGPVAFWTHEACAWSLLGAIVVPGVGPHGMDAPHVSEIAAAVVLVADLLQTSSLNRWNDDPRRTHDEVLAAVDAALNRLSAPASTRIVTDWPRRGGLAIE